MVWPTARLGDTGTRIQIGPFGSLLHAEDYVVDGVPLVNPMHIIGGSITPDPRHAVAVAAVGRLSMYRLKLGDVVMGRRGEMGRCAVVSSSADGHLCGTGSLFLRGNPEVLDPIYLARTLSSPALVAEMERASLGITMPNLNQEIVASLRIPVPPIEEQRRIVSVLGLVDALRAKRREVLVLLDDLAQSLFLDMFGDMPAAVKVGDVCDVRGGLQVTAKRAGLPIERPYLRVANVHRGRLDLNELKNMRMTQAELDRARLATGDVLVVEGHGNPLEIGRAAMWNADIGECVHQNHLIRVRPRMDLLSPVFVTSWLNSRRGRRHLLRAANTTSGLNTISTSDVKATPIPMPALDDQQKFADALLAATTTEFRLRAYLDGLDELFGGLRQRAFVGEL